jgi:hypothetical protein
MATKALEKLSKTELYEKAQKADVPGRSEMTKEVARSLGQPGE